VENEKTRREKERKIERAWQRLADAIREQRQADAVRLAAEAERLRDEKQE